MPNQSDPNQNTNLSPTPNLGLGNDVPNENPVFLDPSVSTPSVEPVTEVTQNNETRPSFLTVEETPSTGATPTLITSVNPAAQTTLEDNIPNNSDPVVVAQPFVVSPSSSGSSSNSGKGKRAAALVGIVGLVAAIVVGVAAVSTSRLQQSSAWDCENYEFLVTNTGTVTVVNGSTRNEPIQKAEVKINGITVQTFDVPALSPGQNATLGNVNIPGGTFTWEVIGTIDCRDGGSYLATPSPTPSLTPTPTASPSSSPSSSPSPTPSGAISCSSVKAYDTNWIALTPTQLTALKAGDIVRFAVNGNATSGTFDKARFTINGVQRSEVTQKRPNTQDYYDQYAIPAGVTTINVTAQIHHVQTNNWY